jgi:hypothetical protein
VCVCGAGDDSRYRNCGPPHCRTILLQLIHMRLRTLHYNTLLYSALHCTCTPSKTSPLLHSSIIYLLTYFFLPQAGENKEWCWDNFINFRSMQSAESVREQLARIMRKLSLPMVRSTSTPRVTVPAHSPRTAEMHLSLSDLTHPFLILLYSLLSFPLPSRAVR